MIRLAPLLLLAVPAAAQEPSFIQPIDCALGETCYIQQFPDHDPSPAVQDFTCGPLSYDGHKGTDFALFTLRDQANGVAVLAAAAGTVIATRDEMPDILQGSETAPDVSGRECGNGMVIRHENGWESQYCHLELGSVTVQPGDTVAAGDTLGMVGLSGETEFPHLHFETRQNGTWVDPFAPDADACGPSDSTLWSNSPTYTPGGFLGLGLTGATPSYGDITAGRTLPDLARDAPMIGWAYYFGSRTGDTITIDINGPLGEVVSHTEPLPQRALGYQYAGARPPATGWQPGSYRLSITLRRNGEVLDQQIHLVTLP